MEISESGLALKETDKLKFHYDKYSPTLTQPNPKGLKVQTFPLQKMGYPSPEEAPPNPGLPYPILNLPEKFKSWLFAGQELVVVYSLNCLTGLKRKKPASTSKTKTTNVSSIQFSVVSIRFMKKTMLASHITIKTLMTL